MKSAVFLGLGIALAVVVADQLSKYYILHEFLGQAAYVSVCPYFNIVRAWNTGVSFSMLNDYGHLGVWILSGLAIIIILMLFHWLRNEINRLTQAALGLIMGGAAGNVIDRIMSGAVFDFLDFHIEDWHWPAFNLADSCICIGAAVVIIQAAQFKLKREGKK